MKLCGRKVAAGVVGALMFGVLALSAGSANAAMPPASYKTERIEFKVRERLPNGKWRSTPVRTGFYDNVPQKGWGQDKAEHRHNIKTQASIRYLASAPTIVKSGTSYAHTVWSNEIKCKNGRCTVTDEREVRGVFVRSVLKVLHGETVGGELGLQTAYCLNPDKALRCPDWVDVGLGKAWSAVSGTVGFAGRSAATTSLPRDGKLYTATTERIGIGEAVDAAELDELIVGDE